MTGGGLLLIWYFRFFPLGLGGLFDYFFVFIFLELFFGKCILIL